MSWSLLFRCDRCRRAYRVRTGVLRFYFVPWQPAGLPAWDRVPCADRDGWCHRCRRAEAIESIPPDLAIDDGTRSRWRRERRSPPRCFCCGSAQVEPLDESFGHPDCGGQFRVAGDPWRNQDSFCDIIPAEGPPERGRLAVWWSHLIGRW